MTERLSTVKRVASWILRINCRTIGQTSLDFSSFITSDEEALLVPSRAE